MSAIPDLQAVATGQAGAVRIEPSPRRVRVRVGATWVADSDDVLYVFEQGHLPVYYFPWRDVRRDLLEPSATTTHCPRKGDASYWNIRVGGRLIEDAVWSYPEVIDGCPDITDHVAFSWNSVDGWFEEDDEVFVHARDPYKRIDTVRSSRHVQVLVEPARSSPTPTGRCCCTRPGCRPVYYIPRLDVREDLLEPSTTTHGVPVQGHRRVPVGARRRRAAHRRRVDVPGPDPRDPQDRAPPVLLQRARRHRPRRRGARTS